MVALSLQCGLTVVFLVSLVLMGLCIAQLTIPAIAARLSVIAGVLTEWTVPTPGSGVSGLTLDPSGNCCWFLEYYGNKVGHLDPSTGIFQEWVIPTSLSNPYSIAITRVSGSLAVWGTEFAADKVFLFYPQSGSFSEYHLTGSNVGVTSISIEPSGGQVRVWFSESFRNVNGEAIYDPNTRNVTLYEDEFPAAVGGGAYGVYATYNSTWFAGFSALVRWDRASDKYTIWPLPVHGYSVGRFITVDQEGEPWYTQGVTSGNSTDNYVGVLRGNSTLEEWLIPSNGADPRGISVNPLTQQPWIAEESQQAGNGTIASLDAYGGGTLVSSVPTMVPAGGTPTVLSPALSQIAAYNHTVTPTTSVISGSIDGRFTGYSLGYSLPHEAIVDSSGVVWISEPGTNKIARLSLSPGFALRPSAPIVSLSQGGTETITITGVSISGYKGQVALTTTMVPQGVSASSFSPNLLNITSAGTASTQFTLHIDPEASAGTNMVTIQGTDGTNIHVIGLILMITNSTATALTTLSRPTRPSIRGLMWESITAVTAIALAALEISRRRKRHIRSTPVS
jgi:streptogramin lyase